MTLKLSMTCGPYDRARALIDGSVKPEGIESFDITVNGDDVNVSQAARGDFDVCEFFTGTYIADLPFKKLGFTAIPIFVKRMFRHSYIYINRGGHSQAWRPQRQAGRRADLDHQRGAVGQGHVGGDHGVDLASIEWVAWQQVRIPQWKTPHWLNMTTRPRAADQFDLLATGEIDAGITTESGRRTDIPESISCFPIMRRANANIFAARAVFRSCTRCWSATRPRTTFLGGTQPVRRLEVLKRKLYERQDEWQRVHMTSLWYRALWEEERAAAGEDIYLWGFNKTRHEVDIMLRYAHRQALTPRNIGRRNCSFHRCSKLKKRLHRGKAAIHRKRHAGYE